MHDAVCYLLALSHLNLLRELLVLLLCFGFRRAGRRHDIREGEGGLLHCYVHGLQSDGDAVKRRGECTVDGSILCSALLGGDACCRCSSHDAAFKQL